MEGPNNLIVSWRVPQSIDVPGDFTRFYRVLYGRGGFRRVQEGPEGSGRDQGLGMPVGIGRVLEDLEQSRWLQEGSGESIMVQEGEGSKGVQEGLEWSENPGESGRVLDGLLGSRKGLKWNGRFQESLIRLGGFGKVKRGLGGSEQA